MEGEEEKKQLILSRARLAQALLEESDQLPVEPEESEVGAKRLWRHARHEREALVCYLLLTCLDLLGQECKHLTFSGWLNSKKQRHLAEKQAALDGAPSNAIEAAQSLERHYQSIYGVKNSFFNGINSLPAPIRESLIQSIQITYDPRYGIRPPNVSEGSYPLEDAPLETKLKLRYLYERRNRFTHKLEQYQRSSQPFLSLFFRTSKFHWYASIENSRLRYDCQHHECVPLSSGGAYHYQINDWPFVLFEAVYAAIGEPFDRTSIDLRFIVNLEHASLPDVWGTLINVPHSELRKYIQLEHEYWKAFDPSKVIRNTNDLPWDHEGNKRMRLDIAIQRV